jgi:plastocyanin/uncharacterized membrane protein YozB (DUF420 family)
MDGFLGTGATLRADLNLVVQTAMGLALLLGMHLARRRRFGAHKYCQTSVMLLNLVLILSIMAPSFHKQVQPNIPAGLSEAYYLMPFIHVALGTLAELLGLYIILVAGTGLVPRKLRFKRYKPWMRTELVIWWLVILLGFATYYVWYIRAEPASAASPAVTRQPDKSKAPATVRITNFQFEPRELTIDAGTTVQWIDQTGRHTVNADDESFKSEVLTAGGIFEHRFEAPGVYPYYCEFHGEKHGKEMAGVITVR